MKFLLILITIISPLQNQTVMDVSLPNIHESSNLFIKNYQNQNFSQLIESKKNQLRIVIKNIDYLQLNLNFIINRDHVFINQQSGDLQKTITKLLKGCLFTGDYLRNISLFLKDNIQYSELNLEQSPEYVIVNKKANCVGFAQLSQILFKAVGIKCQIIQGFFLEETADKKILSPRSHLWLEIFLQDNFSIFYDPQYQSFSHNYLRIDDQMDFTEIKKFKVKILNKTIQLKN